MSYITSKKELNKKALEIKRRLEVFEESADRYAKERVESSNSFIKKGTKK